MLAAFVATLALQSAMPPSSGATSIHPADRIVSFTCGGPKCKHDVLCVGIAFRSRILTNQHCLASLGDAAGEGGNIGVRYPDQVRFDLPAIKLAASKNDGDSTRRSFGLDFAVLDAPSEARQFPDLSWFDKASSPGLGARLVVAKADGKKNRCVVTAICGSDVFYDCASSLEDGDSGSGLWTENGEQLAALHKQGHKACNAPNNTTGGCGQGTASTSIMGRSRAMFSDEESSARTALDRNFSRRLKYRLVRAPEAFCKVEQLEFRDTSDQSAAYVGVVTLDKQHYAALDFKNNKIVSIDAKTHAVVWSVTLPTNSAAPALTSLYILPSGDLVVASSDERKGGVGGIIRVRRNAEKQEYILDQDGLILIPQVGKGVLSVAEVPGGLLIGGESGLCYLEAKVCHNPIHAGKAWKNAWTARRIVVRDDGSIVAFGSDNENKHRYPVALNYSLEAGTLEYKNGWTIRERAGQAFLSALTVDGRVLAFTSEGGIYELKPGSYPHQIQIVGSRTNGGYVEDAIRQATALPGGRVGIASSDGAFHILMPETSKGGEPAYSTSYENSANDLGIWAVALATNDESAAVVTQDGGLFIVGLPSSVTADARVRR